MEASLLATGKDESKTGVENCDFSINDTPVVSRFLIQREAWERILFQIVDRRRYPDVVLGGHSPWS